MVTLSDDARHCCQSVCSCVRFQLLLFLLFEVSKSGLRWWQHTNMIQGAAVAWQGVLSALQGVKAEDLIGYSCISEDTFVGLLWVVAANLVQSVTFCMFRW